MIRGTREVFPQLLQLITLKHFFMNDSIKLPDTYYPSQKHPSLELRYKYLKDILIPAKLFLPCSIRMLIVTDASGSFDTTAPFGLGFFLKAFKYDPLSPATDNPPPYVQFTIKTAHRGSAASDFSNFKFDAHDLGQYDQIWLFGVASFGPGLTASELKSLSRFMNEGGGVFATGDHEDLGVKMCGSVPRVRCMRRWYFNTPDPLGSPKAPPINSINGGINHDTIIDNPATDTEKTQSDNYPQNIKPRYRRVFYGSVFKRRVFPHPVLCGPNGVIKVLPDHMHEGFCDIYQDFGRTLNFDGYSFTEFPTRTGSGTIQKPEVIADNINQVDNSQFASISVYDGHKTDTNGRILCDATWHHFFNINLKGFEDSRDSVRAGSINADEVRAEKDYVNIRAYFRNIAYWLARRNDQDCMRRKGYHIVVHDFDFKIAWKPLEYVSDRLSYFYYWGELAKDSLNHFAPQCQWYEWIFWHVKDFPVFQRLMPILPGEEKDMQRPEPLRLIDIESIRTILLGQAVYKLFEFTEAQKEFSEKTYARFDRILLEGREELFNEVMDAYNREAGMLYEEMKGKDNRKEGYASEG